MKIIATLLLFAGIFICACNPVNNNKKEAEAHKINQATIADTIVGHKEITDEIAGSAYRKRATAFFVVIGEDTSTFKPIFLESKNDGRVGIDLNLKYASNTNSHAQRLAELRLILPHAFEHYNPDLLKGISVGRLILTGDLAIAVTQQFHQKYGVHKSITKQDYDDIANFLLHSKLADDFNKLFDTYSITVNNIWVEKVFLSPKQSLLRNSRVTTDTSEVPSYVLDALTGMGLTRK